METAHKPELPASPPPVKLHALSASVRGAAHRRSGLPNQDAIYSALGGEGEWRAILAVSDGHGSEKCFRSHCGSRLAVEIAAGALREFAVAHSGRPAAETECEVGRLPGVIIRLWRAAVAADCRANPFGEELPASWRHEPVIAYGATLVGVLLGPDYLLWLQLGDGEILTVSRDSLQVVQPIAADAALFANETTSLCQPEAERNFRVRWQRLEHAPPALILLSTDGYPNSFATPEGFRQVATDLLAMLDQDGADSVAASLPGWLDEASELGSGDDVSVALLYCPQETPRHE